MSPSQFNHWFWITATIAIGLFSSPLTASGKSVIVTEVFPSEPGEAIGPSPPDEEPHLTIVTPEPVKQPRRIDDGPGIPNNVSVSHSHSVSVVSVSYSLSKDEKEDDQMDKMIRDVVDKVYETVEATLKDEATTPVGNESAGVEDENTTVADVDDDRDGRAIARSPKIARITPADLKRVFIKLGNNQNYSIVTSDDLNNLPKFDAVSTTTPTTTTTSTTPTSTVRTTTTTTTPFTTTTTSTTPMTTTTTTTSTSTSTPSTTTTTPTSPVPANDGFSIFESAIEPSLPSTNPSSTSSEQDRLLAVKHKLFAISESIREYVVQQNEVNDTKEEEPETRSEDPILEYEFAAEPRSLDTSGYDYFETLLQSAVEEMDETDEAKNEISLTYEADQTGSDSVLRITSVLPSGIEVAEESRPVVLEAEPTQTEAAIILNDSLIIGIIVGAVLFILLGILGVGAYLYHEKYINKPQALDDRYANSDSGGVGYFDDSFRRISHVDCSGFEMNKDYSEEELYNLDNDSFLNSLETMTIPSYWSDSTVRHNDSDV